MNPQAAVILCTMTVVSLEEAQDRLSDLARLVEGGETVVLTIGGRPVADLVPHRPKGGLKLEAGREFKRKHGIDQIFGPIRDDFDDPLPEDFLLRPLS
jgi:antitoxin (DNA-binding transcriptional repressor) of toxin-antitoxin stability system